MKSDLTVLFLWHMHQPAYNLMDEPFLLPWTRLHATKDYLALAEIAANIPNFKTNFNFTPVLWDQLIQYAEGAIDAELALSLKPTSELTVEEINTILRKAFLGNFHSLIKPFKRYAYLYSRYFEPSVRKGNPPTTQELPSIEELRDLLCWRMLSWIDPDIARVIPFIQSAISKGELFTESDKIEIIKVTRELIRKIPSIYRGLAENKKIEMSTTPYYHPILPLLIDSNSAKDALPHIDLPFRFSSLEEADWQIKAAIEKHKNILGTSPAGMWPAEGSVSPEAAKMFAQNKIVWIASDEDILARSAGVSFVRDQFGQINQPDILYRPWSYETAAGKINILFRDHFLSDLIGFEYQKWNADDAVADFIRRLISIKDRLKNVPFQPAVSVILDGENAWEHYIGGGKEFIKKLFFALSQSGEIKLDTITSYLSKVERQITPLPHLASGSWINGNFGIWIGHSEENKAWILLKATLEMYVSRKETLSEDLRIKCERLLHKAEASDWFWWYGDDHYCEEKEEFDYLFRNLLIEVYNAMKMQIPDELNLPLLTLKSRRYKLTHPKALLTPKIDGCKSAYFEWFGAGTVQVRSLYGAMHSSQKKLFDKILFGFDLERIYFRLDPGEGLTGYEGNDLIIKLRFLSPGPEKTISVFLDKMRSENLQIEADGRGMNAKEAVQVAWKEVIELAIPFRFIKARRQDKVQVCFEINREDRLIEQIPDAYGIEFEVPTEDYDNLMWEV